MQDWCIVYLQHWSNATCLGVCVLCYIVTPGLNKDIWCHVWPCSVRCLQMTGMDIWPQVKWTVNLGLQMAALISLRSLYGMYGLTCSLYHPEEWCLGLVQDKLINLKVVHSLSIQNLSFKVQDGPVLYAATVPNNREYYEDSSLFVHWSRSRKESRWMFITSHIFIYINCVNLSYLWYLFMNKDWRDWLYFGIYTCLWMFGQRLCFRYHKLCACGMCASDMWQICVCEEYILCSCVLSKNVKVIQYALWYFYCVCYI